MAVSRQKLVQFVYRASLFMKPVYAGGDDEVVLHAVRNGIDEGLAFRTLSGRPV
ncbi:hypothetical protein [Stenotrophomonas acidaminiphila]|jgi:hypothetical protein|uniref:hypothetical protein n=1 Tax=Stenotrophomonas acidaminiphila TaxID=128780 RepID=UPI000A3DA587|nr:hypothetical protein H7691_03290 [Stenotrophomonas sp. CW117]